MAGLAFLVVGLICAVVSRILLLIAALDVSVWWALGVFLPFGPVFFRLNYPDLAQSSRIFRLATLPCLLLYFALGPGPLYTRHVNEARLATAHPFSYGLEKQDAAKPAAPSPAPVAQANAVADERRKANAQEFDRLHAWSEALKLRKRDLLHSDTEGNRRYNEELAQYNAALAKANAEKSALGPPAQ